MPTTKNLLANLLEFHDDDDDNDDDVDDNDDNDDDEGKQWHGMDRAISFCTHTMHTDERPYTNLDDDDFIDNDEEVCKRNQFVVVAKISFWRCPKFIFGGRQNDLFGGRQKKFLEVTKIDFGGCQTNS